MAESILHRTAEEESPQARRLKRIAGTRYDPAYLGYVRLKAYAGIWWPNGIVPNDAALISEVTGWPDAVSELVGWLCQCGWLIECQQGFQLATWQDEQTDIVKNPKRYKDAFKEMGKRSAKARNAPDELLALPAPKEDSSDHQSVGHQGAGVKTSRDHQDDGTRALDFDLVSAAVKVSEVEKEDVNARSTVVERIEPKQINSNQIERREPSKQEPAGGGAFQTIGSILVGEEDWARLRRAVMTVWNVGRDQAEEMTKAWRKKNKDKLNGKFPSESMLLDFLGNTAKGRRIRADNLIGFVISCKFPPSEMDLEVAARAWKEQTAARAVG